MKTHFQRNKTFLTILCSALIGIALLLQINACQPLISQPAQVESKHPLKGRVYISGSFGEYRKFSRYHMGLDYKTFNRNGLPVHTPYDGLVESVHISELGYGNALFLRTLDGKRLTFAHLHDFDCSPVVDGSLRELELFRRSVKILSQDRNLQFAIPRWFRFRAGECVARTGESGSGPPHLHFEILKNGTFIDPLSLSGYKIEDDTPPVMLELLLESRRGLLRVPLRRSNLAAAAGQVVYKFDQPLPAYAYDEKVRIMISGYDTMAARNRNGIHSLSLKINGKSMHEASLDRIPLAHYARSSRFYHTAYTDIGKYYVFILHPAGSGGYRPGNFSKKDKLNIEASLADASSNQALLRFEIPLTKHVQALPARTSDQTEIRSDQAYTTIQAGTAMTLQASSGGNSISIKYNASSVQLKGRSRLLKLNQLPNEANEKLQVKVAGRMTAVHELAGPVFFLDGQELFYRYGGRGEAAMEDLGPDVGLYYYSYAKKRWRLLSPPRRRSAGKVHYDFPVKITGPIAQLRDLSAPRVVANLLWMKPALYSEDNKFLVREYALSDHGSGLDLRVSQVLMDGVPIKYRWVGDRSVIRLELPPALIPDRGVMISMQFLDQAGNASDWFFEFLEKPSENPATAP